MHNNSEHQMVRIIKRISDNMARSCILVYQKYISPYKGFCCAYRHHTGGHSCSSFALKIVRRYGVVGLIRSLPKQFKRCQLAYLASQQVQEEQKKKDKHDWCEVPSVCDCMPDLPRGCSKPSDGGGSCGDVNLDCNILDGCGSPLEACSCTPFSHTKPMWKKWFRKS